MAHLEGADLSGAQGLTQAKIDLTFGDAETQLPEEPEGLTRPAHWPGPTALPAQGKDVTPYAKAVKILHQLNFLASLPGP